MIWLYAGWAVVGALVGAWIWHVDDEETYWTRQADDLLALFQVSPGRAMVVSLLVAVFLLAVFAVVIIGWPGALVGRVIRFWRDAAADRG